MPTTRTNVVLTLSLACALASAEASAQERPSGAHIDDSWNNPAKAADPPLLPAPKRDERPSQGTPAEPAPPTSISGTALEAPAATAAAPAAPVVPVDTEAGAARAARIAELEARAEHDESRIRMLERQMQLLTHLRFEGMVQPQLLVTTYNTAGSPNLQANGQLPPGVTANESIAKSDGTTTNGTFFRVRRARLRAFYETDVMRLFLQIDPLPGGSIGPGIGTIVRNAEATGIVRWTRDVRTEITAGLFFVPFRKELLEESITRPFIERTWFSRNAFPLERDYGVHVKTSALGEHLVVDLAILNGQPLGDVAYLALPDLNRSKDYVAYLTYRIGFLTVGASGYLGYGQIVDPQALRFKQFSKSAANFQLSAARRVFRALGESRLVSELTLAKNMDTGVVYPFAAPRIPSTFSSDVESRDGRALYVRVEQDIGRRITAGYRYDTYTPETSINDNARDTHAFLLVAKVSRNLRWMNELDWAIDNVHAADAPAPSKHIITYSSVLQAMF